MKTGTRRGFFDGFGAACCYHDLAMMGLTENHGRLLKKITAAVLAALLFLPCLTPPAAAQNCQGWNTAKFFETATADEVRVCLSAGRGPNERDRQRLTALHRAARDTSDPAVIEALLDAGANPKVSSRAGRTPWYYARTNGKIKGSAAYERLRMAIASEEKKVAKKADWSRVQAVPSHRKTVVRLYEDAAPPVRRRIKGRFVSATADSITLVLKSGQTRTVHKQDVHKVRTWRPLKKRKPGWIALGVALCDNGISHKYRYQRIPDHRLRKNCGPRNHHACAHISCFLRLWHGYDLRPPTQAPDAAAGRPSSPRTRATLPGSSKNQEDAASAAQIQPSPFPDTRAKRGVALLGAVAKTDPDCVKTGARADSPTGWVSLVLPCPCHEEAHREP